VCACVALVIQHAKRMRRVILPSVARPAVPYFTTLSHKRHDIREKKFLIVKCILIFSTNFVYSCSSYEQWCRELGRGRQSVLWLNNTREERNGYGNRCNVSWLYYILWRHVTPDETEAFLMVLTMDLSRNSSVDIATRYGLDRPAIESRWGRDFPHSSRPSLWPTQHPVVGIGSSFRG
jgi:hypothetical protein